MKKHNNLWEQIISKENIAIALTKARKNKNRRRNVRKVMQDQEGCIESIQKLLAEGKYKTSDYQIKTIYEPKLRIIYALPFYPDRIIHHAIINVLEPIWDKLMYKHSYSCRKNKGQTKASFECIKWAKKYNYCAQLDLSQFYINIDHEILKETYRRKIKDKQLLACLDEMLDSVNVRAKNIEYYRKLISENVSVEQAEIGLNKLLKSSIANNNRPAGVATGSLPSQWFGNLYMTDFDYYIKDTLGCKAYIRFCDDLLLFSDDKKELHLWVKAAEEYLLKYKRMTFSKCRVYPTTQGVDFCGYRHFKSGVILLRKRTAKRKKKEMRRLIYDLKHKVITKEQAVSKIASANGWLKHAHTYNLRRALRIDEILKEVNAYGEKAL